MELSIIVPVYNVEKYLKDCLDSLLDQDIEDYEIIVVNDGSTDLSQPIIDRYVANHANVHSLIKPNGGLASARNLGLMHASGRYIAFVDSDDMVIKGAYKKVLAKTCEDPDLIVFDFAYIYENREPFIKKGIADTSDDLHKNLIMSPLFAWNKVYKKAYLDKLNIEYPNGKLYEDIPVTIKTFLNTDKIIYIDEVLYQYRQRNDSIMAKGYDAKVNDILDILKMTYDEISEEDKVRYNDELEYLFIEQLALYGAYRFLSYDRPYYREMMDKALKMIRSYYPGFKKNRYIRIRLSLKEKIFIHFNNKMTYYIWHRYLRRV